MSLRSFHIFFIVTALALLSFLGYWSGSRLLAGQDGQNWALAASSTAGILVGIPYLFWFIRKARVPLAVALLFAVPARLHACAMCFGQTGVSSLSRAFIIGGIVLIGFTFLMLGGLVVMIYRIETSRTNDVSMPGARSYTLRPALDAIARPVFGTRRG